MRGNDRGKDKGNNGGGLGSILKVSPDRQATPKAMGHDVLEIHVVVIGQSGPQPSKSLKTMASERDTKVSQNFPEAIPKGSVNDRVERRGVVNKERGEGGRGLDCISS